MNRAALAAAALVGVTAVSGAAVLSGSASAASPAHTKKLVLHQTASHQVGKSRFVGADVDRNRAGEIVGYDSITGKFYPKRNKVVVEAAFALKGGIIVARASTREFGRKVIRYSGPILTGSGKYKGVEGTITAHSPANNEAKTFVTLTYRL